jgi:hypothetical protein
MATIDDRRQLGTPDEVAAFLQVKPGTLSQWRHRQEGPKFIKVGKLVRYRWRDVEKYLAESTAETY